MKNLCNAPDAPIRLPGVGYPVKMFPHNRSGTRRPMKRLSPNPHNGTSAIGVFLLVLLWGSLLPVASVAKDRPSFDKWLAAVREQAGDKGISDRTLDDALNGLQPLERVIRLDRTQPESTFTFSAYLKRLVTPQLVAKGRYKHRENKLLLD